MSGPSFCWACGKPLEKRDGKPVFAVTTHGGEAHRVHKTCKTNESREPELSFSNVKRDVQRYLSGAE